MPISDDARAVVLKPLNDIAEGFRAQETAQIEAKCFSEAPVWCNRAVGAEAVLAELDKQLDAIK